MVLERILLDMNRVNGVAGSMLVEKNGLIIASALKGINEKLLGAMTVAIFATAETSSDSMKHGNLDYIMMVSEKATTFMMDAGKGVLVVVTEPEANFGLIHIEMQRAVEDIKIALEQ